MDKQAEEPKEEKTVGTVASPNDVVIRVTVDVHRNGEIAISGPQDVNPLTLVGLMEIAKDTFKGMAAAGPPKKDVIIPVGAGALEPLRKHRRPGFGN